MSPEDHEMCHHLQDNGEFWYVHHARHQMSQTVHLISSMVGGGNKNVFGVDRMALEDFCRFFADLDICCLCPDFLDGSSSCHWSSSCHEGRWVAGVTAGGCLNNMGISTPLAPSWACSIYRKMEKGSFCNHWYVCPPRELLDQSAVSG